MIIHYFSLPGSISSRIFRIFFFQILTPGASCAQRWSKGPGISTTSSEIISRHFATCVPFCVLFFGSVFWKACSCRSFQECSCDRHTSGFYHFKERLGFGKITCKPISIRNALSWLPLKVVMITIAIAILLALVIAVAAAAVVLTPTVEVEFLNLTAARIDRATGILKPNRFSHQPCHLNS